MLNASEQLPRYRRYARALPTRPVTLEIGPDKSRNDIDGCRKNRFRNRLLSGLLSPASSLFENFSKRISREPRSRRLEALTLAPLSLVPRAKLSMLSGGTLDVWHVRNDAKRQLIMRYGPSSKRRDYVRETTPNLRVRIRPRALVGRATPVARHVSQKGSFCCRQIAQIPGSIVPRDDQVVASKPGIRTASIGYDLTSFDPSAPGQESVCRLRKNFSPAPGRDANHL